MGGACVGESMCGSGRGLVEYCFFCFLWRYPRYTRRSSDAIAANDPMARPMIAAVESWLSWDSRPGTGDGVVVLLGLKIMVGEEVGSVEGIGAEYGWGVREVVTELLVERVLEAFDDTVELADFVGIETVRTNVVDTGIVLVVEIALPIEALETNTLVVVPETEGGVDLITI